MADIELNPDPTSTYGATEDYKTAWNEKYGNVAPAKSASKGEWVAYLSKAGLLPEEEAEGYTRDELADNYGSVQAVAPSAPAEKVEGGDGAGPAPSSADPMKSSGTTATTTGSPF